MSRRPLLALAVSLAAYLLVPSPRAEAQILGTGFANGGVDPFSFYYGYYLPHQAAIAAQPTPLDTINQITAQRQYTALSERSGLYDPISAYGEEDLDPNRSPGSRRGGERVARPVSATGTSNTNLRGSGPGAYYARTARYYPQLRAGRGANRNIAVTKRGGMGGGMGGGMAGPR